MNRSVIQFVPATQQEARIVYIVVIVVMREKEVANLCGKYAHLDKFVCCGRPAIEHQVLFTQLEDKGGSVSLRRGRRCPCT
jgi:hypothetical protein